MPVVLGAFIALRGWSACDRGADRTSAIGVAGAAGCSPIAARGKTDPILPTTNRRSLRDHSHCARLDEGTDAAGRPVLSYSLVRWLAVCTGLLCGLARCVVWLAVCTGSLCALARSLLIEGFRTGLLLLPTLDQAVSQLGAGIQSSPWRTFPLPIVPFPRGADALIPWLFSPSNPTHPSVNLCMLSSQSPPAAPQHVPPRGRCTTCTSCPTDRPGWSTRAWWMQRPW